MLEQTFGERAVAVRRQLSEAAHLLSGARDADVAAASARDLAAAAPGDDLGLARVVSSLDEEAARAHHERTPIGEVNKRLAGALAATSTFSDEFDGDELIATALQRTYARAARRCSRRSRASPHPICIAGGRR